MRLLESKSSGILAGAEPWLDYYPPILKVGFPNISTPKCWESSDDGFSSNGRSLNLRLQQR
jgi:hypothetical protein